MTLPHDALVGEVRSASAESRGKNGYYPSAAYTYKRSLDTSEYPDSKRFILEFDGVYRSAMVYVNNCLAGQQNYGYSQFFVDVTPYLTPERPNEVRVECRSHLDSRWYTGAGIYRDVSLHILGDVAFTPRSLRISTTELDEQSAVLRVEGEIQSTLLHVSSADVKISVIDPSGVLVAKQVVPVTSAAMSDTAFWTNIELASPQAWSPKSPVLYMVTAELVAQRGEEVATLDKSSVTTGIRTISARKAQGLRLNGQPLKLRGACVHHDNGPLGAASYYEAEHRKVTKLKDAGFNAVRASHNPMSEAFLKACDVVGMLVVEEAFDVWTHGKTDHDYSLNFTTDWESDLESMVRRAYNHPSVIMYSIGNEILELGNPSGAMLSRKLVSAMNRMDRTRPVTNGVNGFVAALDLLQAMRDQKAEHAEEGSTKSVNEAMSAGDMINMVSASPMVTQRIREACSVLDVVGLNYADSRYLLPDTDGLQPLLLGTETFPPRIGRNWPTIAKQPHLTGDFTWTGWDYLGEVGIGRTRWSDEAQEFEAPFPWLTAHVGDFGITGVRRPISYYRETVFGLRTVPYIGVQDPANFGRTAVLGQWAWHDCEESWTWEGREGCTTQVEVYTSADRVELLVNNALVGTRSLTPEDQCRVAFEVEYQPGVVRADVYVGESLVASSELHSANTPIAYVAELETPATELEAGQLAFFRLEARDDHGLRNPQCVRRVAITQVNGGELVAIGNGDPKFAGTFSDSAIELHQGQALAIVRVTDPGSVSVNVDAH